MKNMQEEPLLSTIEPLWHALNEKVVPWASSKFRSRCIVAASTLRELREGGIVLPDGVTATSRPWHGKRVRVPRSDQRLGTIMGTHLWPEDGLLCKRVPQLACVINGRSDFRAGDYVLHVPAGHFIIVPPGVPYPDGSRGHTEGEGACDILWLTLWNDVFRCWICRSRDEQHIPSDRSYSCFVQEPQANTLFNSLADEAAQRESSYEQMCECLLLALWTVLRRRISQGRFFQDQREHAAEEGPQIIRDAPIALAKQYIRSHFHEHLTLADVARRVYLSRAQFARRFRDESGQTFTDFVNECRIREAKRLLAETEWPLSTISQLTGITAGHLRAIFLKQTGETPLDYRQLQRSMVRDK